MLFVITHNGDEPPKDSTACWIHKFTNTQSQYVEIKCQLYEQRFLLQILLLAQRVDQAIRSAIKTSVASSWHFISTY